MLRYALKSILNFSLMLGTQAFAEPCFDQAIPLFNVGITAYPDCTEADVVYFVPQNLKIAEHILSGEKSFSWKLDAQGTSAKVLMKARLFVDQGRMLQALIDLKQIKPLRYRLRPFEIRDVSFTGFGAEGLTSQKMLASSTFSDGYFSILLSLNQQGIDLWRESADFGLWSLEPGQITYKLAGRSAGIAELREQTHQLEIESLPACTILGEACPPETNETRIINQSRNYGRLQFHLQYVSCVDFRGQELVEPARAVFDDTALTPDEQWIAYQAALEAYRTEREKHRTECRPILERMAGEDWFKDYAASNRITCGSLHLWPYERIVAGQSDRSVYWQNGVRTSYDQMLRSCSVSTGYNCNEVNQGRICHGSLQSSQTVCFSAAFMREKLNTATGSCLFMLMTQNNVGSWVQSGFKRTPVETARVTDSCVNSNKILANDSSYLAVIDCR